MNIQLSLVLTDITGVTGLSMLRAMIAGERDPQRLAQFRQSGCKHSEAEIVKALTGAWDDAQVRLAPIWSDFRLGAYYRAMRARLGPKQAIVATAHKIARTVYHLLKTGEPYREESGAEYERKRQEREIKHLARRAQKLGYTLKAIPTTAPELLAESGGDGSF